jgi:hypothetical protein
MSMSSDSVSDDPLWALGTANQHIHPHLGDVAARQAAVPHLISVKNPLPIGRPRPPENTASSGAPPVARFATPLGLLPCHASGDTFSS